MRVVAVVAATLLLAGVAEAQIVVNNGAACRAEHSGEELLTKIVFPDGYTVEAPWHVTGVVKTAKKTDITAVLDHIIETRPVNAKRELVELPGPVQMTFSGRSLSALLNEAANLWCATVLKVRPVSPPMKAEPGVASPNRIM